MADSPGIEDFGSALGMKLYPPCTLSEPDGLDLTGKAAKLAEAVGAAAAATS